MDDLKILKLSQFQRGTTEAVFYVNTLKDHLPDNHIHIDKPHKHEFFSTYFFTKGKGIHEIDFDAHYIKPGSIFFLAPGQTHHWKLSDDVEGFVFFHSADFYDMHYLRNTIRTFPFFNSLSSPHFLYTTTGEASFLKLLFNRMYVESLYNRWHKEQYILSLMTQIYIEINRLLNEQNEGENEESRTYLFHLRRFEDLLEENFKEIKSPAKYAEMMNITPKHLNRIVQSAMNQTTNDMILRRVVLEAKRMLMYTDSNFNEVASLLGYYDYPHFTRVFKKQEGLTPTEFIRKYNE